VCLCGCVHMCFVRHLCCCCCKSWWVYVLKVYHTSLIFESVLMWVFVRCCSTWVGSSLSHKCYTALTGTSTLAFSGAEPVTKIKSFLAFTHQSQENVSLQIFKRRAQKLLGGNLKVVCPEFSTLRYAVLLCMQYHGIYKHAPAYS
jgi:hypothetical protein